MTDTAELTLTTLPLDKLRGHPENIRRKVGDVDELSKSIAGVDLPSAAAESQPRSTRRFAPGAP